MLELVQRREVSKSRVGHRTSPQIQILKPAQLPNVHETLAGDLGVLEREFFNLRQVADRGQALVADGRIQEEKRVQTFNLANLRKSLVTDAGCVVQGKLAEFQPSQVPYAC